MADKLWKQHERRTARLLGGERVPVSGRGDGPDVAHPWLSIECKHRRTLPQWLLKALDQAKRAAKGEQLPVAILHEQGRRDSLVVMTLSDFVDLFGPVPAEGD